MPELDGYARLQEGYRTLREMIANSAQSASAELLELIPEFSMDSRR